MVVLSAVLAVSVVLTAAPADAQELTIKPISGAHKRRVALIVMDGVGAGHTRGRAAQGNAVHLARTPNLNHLWSKHPTRLLNAHGVAVGLPSNGDMGNSEVGHNAIGAGRVFAQGAQLVNDAIKGGSIFHGPTWQKALAHVEKTGGALHIMGLHSDGNVHSHIDHLHAMIKGAAEAGVKKVGLHLMHDGRDVEPQSAEKYVGATEQLLADINKSADRDYVIASTGGRQKITMDRYEDNWGMVKEGYDAHVHGKGKRFPSAMAAIEHARAENPQLIDQDMSAAVIERDGKPVRPIQSGDAVIFLNFRGDRALEITRAFEAGAEFDKFDRGPRPENLFYAGMMQYDGDSNIPSNFLVEPPKINRSIGEYLVGNGHRLFAGAEATKFGHMTYFFNGNRAEPFDPKLEVYKRIAGLRGVLEERPWMKAAEGADHLIKAIERRRLPFDFMRWNFPQGDMVGHTGNLLATIVGVEAVDIQVGRICDALKRTNTIGVFTADHGNADQMFDFMKGTTNFKKKDGQRVIRTAHTLNPVPFTIFDPAGAITEHQLANVQDAGLGNIAATLLNLMGYHAPAEYDRSLIQLN